MSDTLPCPFCGGTDIRFTNHGKVSSDPMHREDDVWSTCCYSCGATFPNRYKRQLLVDAWNRRPKDSDEIERAEKRRLSKREWARKRRERQRGLRLKDRQ